MTIERCKKCPYYMVHFKNGVLCNYLFDVQERAIHRGRCVQACPID